MTASSFEDISINNEEKQKIGVACSVRGLSRANSSIVPLVHSVRVLNNSISSESSTSNKKDLTTDDIFLSYVRHVNASYCLMEAKRKLKKDKLNFAISSKKRLDSIKSVYAEGQNWDVQHEQLKQLLCAVEIIKIQHPVLYFGNEKLFPSVCRLEKLISALDVLLQRVSVKKINLPSSEIEWRELFAELFNFKKAVNDLDDQFRNGRLGFNASSSAYLKLLSVFMTLKDAVDKLKNSQEGVNRLIVKEQSMKISENLLTTFEFKFL